MPPLRKLLINGDPPESLIERLRLRFPDVRIVLTSGGTFREELSNTDAVVGWGLTPDDLAVASQVRWLQTIGAGVDGVDIPALAARGIVVTNASGAHAPNIAEHVLAMMLAFARRLPFLWRGQVAHEWRDETGRQGVFELYGQTMLLIGLGDIACALARRAEAFGMEVIAVRRRHTLPVPPGVTAVYGVDHLHDALPLADHVVVTLPLTTRTRKLIDADAIARMKRGAYLYNIGRGPTIDASALLDALRRGHLAGAGLDVTDPEPLPADSPLWDMGQVMITAHTSGSSPARWDRTMAIVEENVDRFLADQPLINTVDPAEGY